MDATIWSNSLEVHYSYIIALSLDATDLVWMCLERYFLV